MKNCIAGCVALVLAFVSFSVSMSQDLQTAKELQLQRLERMVSFGANGDQPAPRIDGEPAASDKEVYQLSDYHSAQEVSFGEVWQGLCRFASSAKGWMIGNWVWFSLAIMAWLAAREFSGDLFRTLGRRRVCSLVCFFASVVAANLAQAQEGRDSREPHDASPARVTSDLELPDELRIETSPFEHGEQREPHVQREKFDLPVDQGQESSGMQETVREQRPAGTPATTSTTPTTVNLPQVTFIAKATSPEPLAPPAEAQRAASLAAGVIIAILGVLLAGLLRYLVRTRS